MRNFFKELCVCESAVLNKGGYTSGGGDLVPYSVKTRMTVTRLVGFVEAGSFTRAKSSKFVAKYFRYSPVELCSLWEAEFGKKKSANTFRSQISVTSTELYKLFGTGFSESLLRNEPDDVFDMLTILGSGTDCFSSLFPEEISSKIVSDTICRFEPEELAGELRFLSRYRKSSMEEDMSGLSMEKLACIRKVLDEPLVADHDVNLAKVGYLKALANVNKPPAYPPQDLYIHSKITALYNENTVELSRGNSVARKDMLKNLFRMFYTEDGVRELLRNYTRSEILMALSELKKGN